MMTPFVCVQRLETLEGASRPEAAFGSLLASTEASAHWHAYGSPTPSQAYGGPGIGPESASDGTLRPNLSARTLDASVDTCCLNR